MYQEGAPAVVEQAVVAALQSGSVRAHDSMTSSSSQRRRASSERASWKKHSCLASRVAHCAKAASRALCSVDSARPAAVASNIARSSARTTWS
jgi:hypothetical protein